MHTTVAALLVLLVAAAGWAAGASHIESCRDAGKTGCSVVPWSGHKPPPRARLGFYKCVFLRHTAIEHGLPDPDC